jgi:HAD superfamily hydrolase (TIGR01509 family)
VSVPYCELVIFDCDGVLIDSEVIGCRIDAECFAEIGLPIGVEEVTARYVGISTRTMFADVERRFNVKLPEDFGSRIRARVTAAFEKELAIIPGIEAVLDALPCRCCVASSSGPDRLRHALSLVGLARRFEPHIFSATQVENGKPAPDLFLFAARTMGVTPEQCVVIEDSVAGVQAAVAAGMRVFGFTGGGHCGPCHGDLLREAGAYGIFGHMREFPSLHVRRTD